MFHGGLISCVDPQHRTDAKTLPRPSTADRLFALDLARFMAMLFMMQGHVLDALVRGDVIDVTRAPWDWWHVIRGLTAPVFLMVSGAVHVFANKRGDDGRIREDVLERRIRSSIMIILLGYLMVFPANRIWDVPFVPEEGWRVFNAVNILQLTGMTMLLFVFVMRGTRSIRSMGLVGLGTAIAIMALSPAVASINWFGIVPGWVEGYLTISQGTIFPMFVFSSYLYAGVYVGSVLQAIPQERRMRVLRQRGWIIGLIIAGVAYGVHAFLLSNGVPMTTLESASSPLLAVRRMGIVIMIFAAATWIVERTWRLREWYSMYGKRSLSIYVIHLVLLWGTPWFDGVARRMGKTFDLGEGFMAVAIIMASTLIIAWALDRYDRMPLRPELRRNVRYGVYAVLLYALLV